MTHLYLSRWRWYDTPDGGQYWASPNQDITLGTLDLRSYPQCGTPGPVAQGYGVFATSQRDSVFDIYLGEFADRDALRTTKLRAPTLNGLKNALGVNFASQTPLDILWELLTQWADPTGQARWKPLMPEISGNLNLYLGGFSAIASKRFNYVTHPLVLPTEQEDYRRIRAEGGPYRKFLGSLYAKYALPWRFFIPPDLPQEPPESPETTITDNFNRADADALGTSAEGWSWTETRGDIDIVTNTARGQNVADPDAARAESALSSADQRSQVVVSWVANSRPGCAARYAAAATTFYGGNKRPLANDLTYQIDKVVAGATTVLATLNDPSEASGTLKLEVNGSALELFFDAVSKLTATDTAITGNTLVGIYAHSIIAGRPIIDTFEAADLVAEVASDNRLLLKGVGI